MRLVIIYLLLLVVGHNKLLSQVSYWNEVYDFSNVEAATRLVVEDSFIIISATKFYTQTGMQLFYLKLNNENEVVDSLKIGFQGSQYLSMRVVKIQSTLPKKYYIGSSTLFEPGDPDPGFYYFKFDENMNLIWEKTYRPSVAKNVLMKCLPAESGEFYLAGYIRYPDSTSPLRYYLGRFDTVGSMIWEQVLGDTLHFHHLYDATRTSDGGFLLCGTRWTNTDKDIYIVKTDSLGNQEWDKVYGGGYDDFALTCTQTGTQYIIGGARYINYSNYNAYLMKLDSLGNKIWDKDYDFYIFYTASEIVDIKGLQDNTMVFLENGQKPNSNNFPHLKKITKDGDIIWSRTYHYNPTYNEYLWDVAQTTDKGFIMVGQAIGPQGQDVWLVKTDSLGCLVAGCDTATGTAIQIVPAPGNKLQAWPNPAREVLYVAHNGYTGQEVSYRLISLSGQVVQSGTAILPKALSLQGLAEGMYILQVSTAEGILIGTSKVAICR